MESGLLNESETRQQIIDKKLKLAGWNVSDPSQVIQELEIVLKNPGHIPMAMTSIFRNRNFTRPSKYMVSQAGMTWSGCNCAVKAAGHYPLS
jgi:hypothetical protein